MSPNSEPRAAFSFSLTEEEYMAAARVASRRYGRLRDARIGFGLCAALTAVMVVALASYRWAALFLLFCGGVIALCTFVLLRHAALRAMRQNYHVFSNVVGPVQVTLWEDWLDYNGEGVQRQEPYALFSQLAETPASFVLLQEDGGFLAIPKRACLQDDGRAADFLRTTFARKYRRTR